MCVYSMYLVCVVYLVCVCVCAVYLNAQNLPKLLAVKLGHLCHTALAVTSEPLCLLDEPVLAGPVNPPQKSRSLRRVSHTHPSGRGARIALPSGMAWRLLGPRPRTSIPSGARRTKHDE